MCPLTGCLLAPALRPRLVKYAGELRSLDGRVPVRKGRHRFATLLAERCRAAYPYTEEVNLTIELDREDDGRWIAEALELPGVMSYGATPEDAMSKTERLAIEVIADRIQHGELPPAALNVSFRVVREQLAGD